MCTTEVLHFLLELLALIHWQLVLLIINLPNSLGTYPLVGPFYQLCTFLKVE